MIFSYVVSELPFLPFSPHLVTEHWGCSYVLTLIQKHIKNILKWAVNLHPIQCILIITESIIFFLKKKKREKGREVIFSRSVSTREQLFYLELTNTLVIGESSSAK